MWRIFHVGQTKYFTSNSKLNLSTELQNKLQLHVRPESYDRELRYYRRLHNITIS